MPEQADIQEHQPGREYMMTPAPEFMPRYPGSGRLKDRVAVITGGDSGIGRAVAVLFAREGADVSIVFLEETRDARETMERVRAEGGRCKLIAGDVADEAFCRHAVDSTVDEFGRLDVLVNNAAEQHPRETLEDIPTEQLERTFATNVFGYFHMTRAALRHMGEGAAIVNTTSVTAYRGSWHLIDYSATRGAIVSFTRSLSKTLMDRKIRVNAVAPGPVWTPLIPSSFRKEEKVRHFGESSPMGRVGQPNEVAPCHLFLACEDSSFMSGQVLHPNGGEVIGG
jgi:NAD(P)-dependent dehydrogenase (short-subunit alcohol dehydrogenase family)